MGEDADYLLAKQLQAEEEEQAKQVADGKVAAERQFESRIHAGIAQVKEYEDEFLQAMAQSILPTPILELASHGHSRHEELAKGLLLWFKQECFTWVDSPECQHCGSSNTQSRGRVAASSADERAGRASVVELYFCPSCSRTTRFPRYNHPGKLLETRRGRCGEWANAFTLLCRSVGLDARWVLDWTDHVWTEFYCSKETRWIHLDPCENEFDKAHLYEGGWGKKLSYVIAFGRYGVTDVSRRYSKDCHAMAERQRQIADPKWVQQLCHKATSQLRSTLGSVDVLLWEERDRREREDLGTAAQQDSNPNLPGRQTGSVQWRAQRGELGNGQIRGMQLPPYLQEDHGQLASDSPAPTFSQAKAEVPSTSEAPEAGTKATPMQEDKQLSSNRPARGTVDVKDEDGGIENGCSPGQVQGATGTEKKPLSREEFTKTMQKMFAEFMASGDLSPNEAALLALEQLRL